MTGEIGGGIALERDLIKERLEFLPNKVEHELKNSIKVIKMNEQGFGSSTMYTVPPRHTLFLTNIWVSARSLGTAGHTRIESSEDQEVALCRADVAANSCCTLAQSFPIPFKFEEGTLFRITTFGANITGSGSVLGFLIKKPIV